MAHFVPNTTTNSSAVVWPMSDVWSYGCDGLQPFQDPSNLSLSDQSDTYTWGSASAYSSPFSSAVNSPISFDQANDVFTFNVNDNLLLLSSTNDEPKSFENNSSQIKPLRVPRNENYCETVAVESSAHVAQIVGKNGCKIKHLRAKFSTYIHTPGNDEEPVFIIKGKRENVFQVKQEILKAANHFTQIKNCRMQKIAKIINSENSTCLKLFMPAKFIGLVVGRNGWFVKDLQMKYNIYIETPKFDLCNFFRLYGVNENLHKVKNLIYEHVMKKTGINLVEKEDGNDIYFLD